MPDIIQLLPDHLANQIAAGEVIQRPASAVKELLENAIDAGASNIQLILKDAGKELIQVVDNGKGMSAMDARMSFERHATSKIKKIEDLFAIRTKGFRGEALASIAAVAQVVLKTRQHADATGSLIEIESSNVTKQEVTACAEGTNFSVKNLFYNVPARRHFLKSNTTELKHILDEFTRIALAHPEIAFKMTHNNVEQFNLHAGNVKQRILALLGNNMDKNLVPVEEETDLINISGYVAKPEAATRTRGNQFFFINKRFIKSPYLNHAVTTAFEGLIAKDAFPAYVLFLEIDPSRVDVNVHPTKQEVKFDDDKMMYAYLQAAVKFALNKFNVAPSIDFTLDPEIQNLDALKLPQTQDRQASAKSGYLYNQFSNQGQSHFIARKEDKAKWEQQRATFFPQMPSAITPQNPHLHVLSTHEDDIFMGTEIAVPKSSTSIIQWKEYFITTVKSGILMLHQKRAMERIIYERLCESSHGQAYTAQQLLFPIELKLSLADAVLLNEIIPDLKTLGYIVEANAQDRFTLIGTPTDMAQGHEEAVLEAILEQLKNEKHDVEDVRREQITKTMAKRMAVARQLNSESAQALIDELFACAQPQYAPDGKKIFRILSENDISQLL